MANNDWDLDDLLDFQFDREVPEKSKTPDIDNDRKLYEELRRKSKSSNAPAFDVPEPRAIFLHSMTGSMHSHVYRITLL